MSSGLTSWVQLYVNKHGALQENVLEGINGVHMAMLTEGDNDIVHVVYWHGAAGDQESAAVERTS